MKINIKNIANYIIIKINIKRKGYIVMKINILGYNIFSKGGTSSNINLIKSLLSIGVEVHYFNYLDFNKNDILKANNS